MEGTLSKCVIEMVSVVGKAMNRLGFFFLSTLCLLFFLIEHNYFYNENNSRLNLSMCRTGESTLDGEDGGRNRGQVQCRRRGRRG